MAEEIRVRCEGKSLAGNVKGGQGAGQGAAALGLAGWRGQSSQGKSALAVGGAAGVGGAYVNAAGITASGEDDEVNALLAQAMALLEAEIKDSAVNLDIADLAKGAAGVQGGNQTEELGKALHLLADTLTKGNTPTPPHSVPAASSYSGRSGGGSNSKGSYQQQPSQKDQKDAEVQRAVA